MSNAAWGSIASLLMVVAAAAGMVGGAKPAIAGEYLVWDVTAATPSEVRIRIEGEPTSATTLAAGFWLLEASSRHQLASAWAWVSSSGVHVALAAGAESVAFWENPGCSLSDITNSLGFEPCRRNIEWSRALDEGEWVIVAAYGLDGEWRGGATAEVADGAITTAVRHGSARLVTDREFGATKAFVQGPAFASVKGAVSSSWSSAYARSLFGFFSANTNSELQELSVRQPDGTLMEGASRYGFGGLPPGKYEFLLEQLDAGGPFLEKVPTILLSADVDLGP